LRHLDSARHSPQPWPAFAINVHRSATNEIEPGMIEIIVRPIVDTNALTGVPYQLRKSKGNTADTLPNCAWLK